MSVPTSWEGSAFGCQFVPTFPTEGPRPPVISIAYLFIRNSVISFQSYPSGTTMVVTVGSLATWKTETWRSGPANSYPLDLCRQSSMPFLCHATDLPIWDDNCFLWERLCLGGSLSGTECLLRKPFKIWGQISSWDELPRL